MKVLIDGENLRHQLAHVLHMNEKVSDWNDYFKFETSAFLREVLHADTLDINYYTTRVKQPRQKIPIKLQKRITAISTANRKWLADLSNQKINIIKAGNLSIRESSVCVHCGKKTLVLQEKGVDVQVATELVLYAENSPQEQIVLGSSDSDLLPALSAAKSKGLDIVYLCYAGWLNRAVASQATKTITFDDIQVLKYFRGNK